MYSISIAPIILFNQLMHYVDVHFLTRFGIMFQFFLSKVLVFLKSLITPDSHNFLHNILLYL
jgi:hypothetical protein